MAAIAPRTVRLGELLQEQQDPFTMEDYLSEKGYCNKSLNSKVNFGCCHGKTDKVIKLPTRLNKSRTGIPRCSKLLEAVYEKFISINKRSKTKTSDDKRGKPTATEKSRDDQEAEEPDRYSSASSTTVYNSCRQSDAEEPEIPAETSSPLKLHDQREKKAATDRKLQWRTMVVDHQQRSPVSMLEEPISLNTTQVYSEGKENSLLPKKIAEKSILSASLWDSLLHSAPEKSSAGGISPQCLITKRVLEQTKQLLFDCIRELVETHERENKARRRPRDIFGPEELGDLISNEVMMWGKRSSMTKMLDFDVKTSAQEWGDFEHHKREIGLEIGDVILEDVMNEIVRDAVD